MPQQQTRTELEDLTYSNLPNNTAGFIDPEKLREVLLAAWASLHNLLDDGNLAPGNGSTMPAQQAATFGNLGGAAQDNSSLVNYLTSLGHTLTEFTPPLLAQQGRWYIAGTGIWEAKSNFNAGAFPAPGAYWRRIVDFGDALTATDAGKALLAAPTALVQRNLLDIFSVPAGTYGQGQPAFTNLYKEDGAVVYLLKKVEALAIQLVANSPAQATGPTVTGFLPAAAAIGASITLTGTGFTRATSVSFNGTTASFQVLNATTIVAVVPVGATSGPVAMTTSTGTGTSAASFTVSATATPTAPTGTAPTVTGFNPTSAAVGTSVTISGTGFTGATGVLFNGTASSFTVLNATTISVTVPAGATTGRVSVATPSGTGQNQVDFTVTASTTTPSADLTAALAISVASLTLGAPVSFTITPAKGTAPYTYEVLATNTNTGQQFALGDTKTGSWTAPAAGYYSLDAFSTPSSQTAARRANERRLSRAICKFPRPSTVFRLLTRARILRCLPPLRRWP
jgi:hypothetical protein